MKVNDKARVGKFTFVIAVYLALVVDIVEAVLGATGVGEAVNYMIDAAKFIVIPLFFALKDIPPSSPGVAKRLIINGIIALIPWVGSFYPEVLITVWATLKQAKKEDEKNIAAGVGVEHNSFATRLKRGTVAMAEGRLKAKKSATTRAQNQGGSSGGSGSSSKGENVTRQRRNPDNAPRNLE